MRVFAAMTVVALMMIETIALGHEGMSHHQGQDSDARMQKLHEIMPAYAQAQSKINDAFTNGDANTIKEETGKIIATIPDLKKAKPHKNVQQISQLKKIASEFGEDINKTAVLAKAGDLAGAKKAFKLAQMRCDECHKKFRD